MACSLLTNRWNYKLKILIDAYHYGRPFGYGRVVGELCRALRMHGQDHEIYAAIRSDVVLDEAGQTDNFRFVPMPVTNFVKWEQYQIPALAQSLQCDVIHFPYNTCAAITRGIAKVVTVHDLLFLYHYPSMRNPHSWIAASYLRNAFKRLTRRADEIISVSHTTASALRQEYGLTSSVIYNTAEGFTSLPVTRSAGPRYVFHRGSTAEYRNTAKVIEAYRQVVRNVPGLELRIMGVPHGATVWDVADLPGVQFLGRLSDEELANLYANASCLLAVSTMEGFCLPIIEAFGFDVPVVASSADPMCEIAGGAALIADPHSVEAIADRLTQALTSEVAESLVEKGRQRRAVFASGLIARQHLESYERAGVGVTRRGSARHARRSAVLKDQRASRHAQ